MEHDFLMHPHNHFSRFIEQFLVAPTGVLGLEFARPPVVVAIKEDAEGEKEWVLVATWVAKHCG